MDSSNDLEEFHSVAAFLQADECSAWFRNFVEPFYVLLVHDYGPNLENDTIGSLLHWAIQHPLDIYNKQFTKWLFKNHYNDFRSKLDSRGRTPLQVILQPSSDDDVQSDGAGSTRTRSIHTGDPDLKYFADLIADVFKGMQDDRCIQRDSMLLPDLQLMRVVTCPLKQVEKLMWACLRENHRMCCGGTRSIHG